jgi:hypothetical protein
VISIFNQSGTTLLTCVNNSIDLIAEGAATYTWFNGVGQIIGNTAAISVSQADVYTVTGTSISGCNAEASIAITSDGAIPTVTISASTYVLDCNTTSITLNGSGNGALSWSNGLGNSSTVEVDTPGIYTLTTTGANGCAASASITITEDITPPVASVTSSGGTVLCPQSSLTLTASAGNSYLWNTNETTQSIEANTPGTYVVQVTGANGCSAIANNILITAANAIQPVITPNGPISFCQGGSVTLVSSSGSSYLWNTGSTTQTISVGQSGDYFVTVTNASGCALQSNTITIETYSNIEAFITNSGDTSICEGQSLTLTASSGAEYLWSNGSTSSSLVVNTEGSYSVEVTDAGGCSGTSDTIDVVVTPYPYAIVSIGGSTSFCSSESVTLTVSGADSYLWSNGATTQSVTVNTGGDYVVTTTNGANCSTSSNPITIEVVDYFVYYEDNDLDGYGDSNSPVFTCSLSPGLSQSPGDCDDNNFDVGPAAVDVCDGLDNNCDSIVDEFCGDIILGCIDSTACNFDAGANTDDNSCTYPGCMDITAINFNPTAGCDDNSCIYNEGCTDILACNYDATAVINNGTCIYPGCTDSTACNFNPAAGCDDGSCTLPGCTDPDACNYDVNAGCDDGSCYFLANPEITGEQLPVTFSEHYYFFPCNDNCTYQWSAENGLIVGADDSCVVYVGWANQGFGSLTLQVNCDEGCSIIETYQVLIQPDTASIIHSLSGSPAMIYPNPTLQVSTLSVPEHWIGSSMLVQSMSGSIVFEGRVNSRLTTIDASTWAAGVYSLFLVNDLEQTTQLRLIKE